MSFVVKECQLLDYGPHPTFAGRYTGMVRVKIEETFLGSDSAYPLDLKVRAEAGADWSPAQVRQALLVHAAQQLNRLKARLADTSDIAAE